MVKEGDRYSRGFRMGGGRYPSHTDPHCTETLGRAPHVDVASQILPSS